MNFAYEHFTGSARSEIDQFLSHMSEDAVTRAADLIIEAQQAGQRLHVSGIGKPGHVAGYAASLFSSTGTPAYVLHGTEAVHGSCGQLRPGDVVIFISNSGNTAEMRSTVAAIKNNGCRLIGVTGNPDSWLAQESDVVLPAGVSEEGGPLNRAPRNSISAEILILQALSVVLQDHWNITPQQYVRWHPGGALGSLRENER